MTRIRVAALTALVAWLSMGPTTADAARRIVFTETEITGEVQRPQVSVLITRQNLNDPYEMELKESFLPKILDAVEHPPF
jgi:hypothetical protein